MTTGGTGPIPTGPNSGINRRQSLSPPRNVAQTSRATSSAHGSTGSSLTVTSALFDKLRPAAGVGRYDRSAKLGRSSGKDNDLPPLTTSFDDEQPQNWTPLTHPEGALYWVYEPQEGKGTMPIYTDAYLYDKNILQEIEKFREAILDAIHNEASKMPTKWELVLDLVDDENPDESACDYYFVNHSNRSLFWLHPFDMKPFLHNLPEVKHQSKRRMQQALESHYWNHWETFPHDREVPDNLLKELMGIMIHAGLDDMTSHESTSVYSGDELQKFAHCVERIRHVGGTGGYSACVVGRLMKFFTHGRYINFYGQREARLSADQSIFEGVSGKERTWLIKIMSFLLFFGPEVHLKALDSVYVDFVVCQHKWAKFIYKVQNEWRELCRIGTVLLTANVAFLAIPTVDNSTNSTRNSPRTPAQVASFLSVIFSLGCLAIGQLLLRHHMVRPQDSAQEVDKYLRSYHNHRGLETLAVLYSLPYSLLLWAMASFFVAFTFVTLVDSEGKWQRYPSAAVMFVFIVLLIWCVWTTRKGGEDPAAPAPSHGGSTPLQGNKGRPGEHDQGTPLFRSVQVDPNP